MRLTEEHANALINAARDDSTKIIEYFEEKEANEKKQWWIKPLIFIAGQLVGILFVVLAQYINFRLGIN